jgi:hypothetical protein
VEKSIRFVVHHNHFNSKYQKRLLHNLNLPVLLIALLSSSMCASPCDISPSLCDMDFRFRQPPSQIVIALVCCLKLIDSKKERHVVLLWLCGERIKILTSSPTLVIGTHVSSAGVGHYTYSQ